jgi:glyoxylase-like metal-dependent hydrolase (beta-lactamase superfamily II)
MRKNIEAACLLAAVIFGEASAQSPAANVVRKAAEALGGVDRIMAVRSLRLEGYGQDALQDGGGNTSASIEAPQRWNNVMSWEETIDLANQRIRIRQRSQSWLPAATLSRVIGNVMTTSVLDGDVPYTVNAQGAQRRANSRTADNLRTELNTHPVAVVRLALDASAVVNNLRTEGKVRMVDIAPRQGPRLTLATDIKTGLPVWVRWMENDGMLRDLTSQKWFTGFEPINGVMMPTGFKTVIDFRNVVQSQIYITRNSVDGPIDDLAASQTVRAAAITAPQPLVVEATPVAKGIWLLHGSQSHNSILIEFADHLTMFEAPLNEAWTRALIEKARSTVPGKPLTEAIVSHHHFDHSGGVRTAIAEGLSIIAHRGTEDLFREIAARKSTLEPDELGRNPKPLKFIAVDDHMTLKDPASKDSKDNPMQIELYHIIGNEHMAEALMAWVPRDRLLIEGDLFDYTWQNYPWTTNYADNVKLRKLDVDKDVPVHGVVMPWKEVLQSIDMKVETTRQLCKGQQGPLLPECEMFR